MLIKKESTDFSPTYKALVIGVSAGGLKALSAIIPSLPSDFPLPIVIVPHRKHESEDYLVSYLNKRSSLTVLSASIGAPIKLGCVYIAPSGYHLLIERDKTFSLSIDAKVNYSIPSIDILFDSAAIAYQETLIGLILTGANNDGSLGLRSINFYHGLSLVQDPKSAEFSVMPQTAINTTHADYIIPLVDISDFLIKLLME